MNTFLTNKNYRMLLINQWVSSFGDTLFYISFISYVSGYKFASLAVLCITVSETLPQISQLFTGVIADFQKNRVAKYIAILASKFLLYTLLTLFVTDKNFSMGDGFSYLWHQSFIRYHELFCRCYDFSFVCEDYRR